ncbi:MAG: M24 family metallopeptidase [Rhabdochlamydiaceae bacterium]
MKSENYFLKRIDKLKAQLNHDEGLIIYNPIDLFYLTGLELSHGFFVCDNQKATLIVDHRYIQAAQEKSPISVQLLTKEAIKIAISGVSFLKFDSSTTSYQQYIDWKERFPHLTLIPINHPLAPLRLIKDLGEITNLKKSADLLKKGYQHILNHLKEGISEKELSSLFSSFVIAQGADGLAFDPIIAFGANSAKPHHRAHETRLQKGDLILIDIGVKSAHYHSDMTRCHFFQTDEHPLMSWYEIIKEAQKAALSFCKPGRVLKEVDMAARSVLKKHDLDSYFTHNLGHGVGLQIHEQPRLHFEGDYKEMVLEPGLVFTIEPGLYKEGLGGVRYEDTIVITENGYDSFSGEVL